MSFFLSEVITMLEKYAVWKKTNQNSYIMSQNNDMSMAMLCFLFGDGLGLETYVDYLEDDEKKTFTGNFSMMQKHNSTVTVMIDVEESGVLPDFSTTIDNLIRILKEYHYYEEQLVDVIKISLIGNELTVIGTQNGKITYNNQKIIFTRPADSPRYIFEICEGESSYLFAIFLTGVWSKDIDQYVKWALNPNENYTLMFSSILEKKDGFVFIGQRFGENDSGGRYRISIDNFVEILEKWKAFGQAEEPKLMIYEEDGRVKIKSIA